MKAKHYEAPETDVIPMSFLEDVCINPSGNVPDYNKRTDFIWDDEED